MFGSDGLDYSHLSHFIEFAAADHQRLAGALGDALANRCFETRWVAHVRQSRAIRITDRGCAALKAELRLAFQPGEGRLGS